MIGFLKGVGRALEQSLSLLSPLIFAGIYLDIQNLVQETVHIGAYNRKGDVALLLEQLRAVLGEFTPDGRAVVGTRVKVPAVEVRVVRPSAAQASLLSNLILRADWKGLKERIDEKRKIVPRDLVRR